MKHRINLIFLHLGRLLCMNEPYFYLSLFLPAYFVFFHMPPKMETVIYLTVFHYLSWRILMQPLFEKRLNMTADRKELERKIAFVRSRLGKVRFGKK